VDAARARSVAEEVLASASPAVLARPHPTLPAPGALPGGCQYEPKWDGYRALVLHVGDAVHVRSRHGKDLTAAFPDLVEAAAEQLRQGDVLDGEVVIYNGGRLDFTALQRRVIHPAGAAARARELPASFIGFDVLAAGGIDLRSEPLRRRRVELVSMLARCRPPLQITPASTDVQEAQVWLTEWATAGVGVEGIVAKGLGQRYVAGRRDWLKVRHRDTVEVLVGAVIGSLKAPERLVLALPGPEGLIVAGGTGPLTPAQQAELGTLLTPDDGQHPWPIELPRGRTGGFGGGTIVVTLVRPDLVVEVDADTAFEHGKWRHLTKYVRPRPDLGPGEVVTGPVS
jgi:ATP-dependent DNA ligase